jgi:hypothetical protein
MLDHDWGREAFTRFPDLIEDLDFVSSPYDVWFVLTEAFKKAYKAPRNEDLISRIYAYAAWCCEQPRGETAENDLGSCVCVCFYEHIPQSPEALEDMPRWFSRADVLAMRELFSYHVGDKGFQRILQAYQRPGRGQV